VLHAAAGVAASFCGGQPVMMLDKMSHGITVSLPARFWSVLDLLHMQSCGTMWYDFCPAEQNVAVRV
jgi:hypothetical protein